MAQPSTGPAVTRRAQPRRLGVYPPLFFFNDTATTELSPLSLHAALPICIATIRELLSYIPSNNLEDPPRANPTDDVNRVDPDLDAFIPESPNHPYEMRDLIRTIADDAHFLEVHQDYARNLVVGFMRSEERRVGKECRSRWSP